MAHADPLRQAVELDLFEGPFDLLLTLVLREEIDLFELPLADLVERALGGPGDRWDAATASELIVLLAAMAELKARRLVGEPADEEPDEDALEARERLAARLIAYAPFSRAAGWLAERAEWAGGQRYRRVPIEGAPPPEPEGGTAADLAAALAPLLVSPPQPSLDHLESRRISIPEALARLRAALARGARVSFDALTAGAGRLEEGATLMAALELARRGEARLRQDEPFGDILVSGGDS